jgi:hypothetical protein
MSGKRGGRGGFGGASKLSVSKELLKRSAAEAGLDDRHLKVLSDITRPPLFPDFYWHSAGKYWEAANVEDEVVEAVADGGSSSFARKQRHPHSIKSESAASPQPLQQAQRPASVIALMNKQRELFARMQNGPYGIRPTPVMDVVRFNRRRNNETANHSHHPDVRVLASLSCAASKHGSSSVLDTTATMTRPLGSDARYFPAELLGPTTKSAAVVVPKPPLPRKIARGSAAAAAAAGVVAQTSTNSTSTPLDELAWRESKRLRATSVGDKDESGGGGGGDLDEDDELALNLPEEEEDGEDYTTNYYNTDDEEDHKDGGGGGDGEEEPTF